MSEVHDILVGVLGNGAWFVLMGVFVAVAPRVRQFWKTPPLRSPSVTVTNFVINELLRVVRSMCGITGFAYGIIVFGGHWMSGTLVRDHVIGWFLMICIGLILAFAYWADPPDDYPNWPKPIGNQSRWWSAAVQAVSYMIICALIANAIYFRPDVVEIRHRWQANQDQQRDTRVIQK
jgi:hypothetical protein